MAKVYLLFQGSFSDRGCLGVFSSEAEARRQAAAGPDMDVEVVELDELVGWEYGPVHTAEINLETGAVYPISKYQEPRHPTVCSVYQAQDRIIVGSPVSHDHAVKVAIEKRQEWLRDQVPQI